MKRFRYIMLLAVAGCCHVAIFQSLAAEEPAATESEPAAKKAESAAPAGEPVASPADPLPPALIEYKGRKIATTMHFTGAPWLVRDSREREEECSTLLNVLKLRAGNVVCDLGCGNGFYALEMARLVGPTGKIIGVDIQPEMLRMLRERAKVAEIDNIEPVLGSLINPNLPAGKVDLVFCVDAYHEFSHPVHMLREIRTALSPEGRLVLVEFRAEDPKVPIKPLHKMSKKQVLAELVPNGFKLVEEFDELPWQHVMFFGRDEEWQGPADESDDGTESD